MQNIVEKYNKKHQKNYSKINQKTIAKMIKILYN